MIGLLFVHCIVKRHNWLPPVTDVTKKINENVHWKAVWVLNLIEINDFQVFRLNSKTQSFGIRKVAQFSQFLRHLMRFPIFIDKMHHFRFFLFHSFSHSLILNYHFNGFRRRKNRIRSFNRRNTFGKFNLNIYGKSN